MESKSVESSEQSVFRRRSGEDQSLLNINYAKWSSRLKNFQGYSCYTMNFQTILNFSLIVGEFGIVSLFPYFIFRIFIGIPAVLMKMLADRYALGNLAKTWSMTPLCKGILYCSLIKTVFSCITNGISITFLLKYLGSSIQPELPWEICNSAWAKENCYSGRHNVTEILLCSKKYTYSFCQHLEWEPSALQYWNFVVKDTQIKNVSLSIICVVLSTLFFLLAIYKGIRSIERFFNIFVYLPVVLATILASMTFVIPGVFCGSSKMWFVNYSNLLSVQLWSSVFDETMVALGVGHQAVSCVANHGKFSDDFFIDVLVVSFSDIFCCLLLAAPVLSVIASKNPCSEKRKKGKYFEDKSDVFVKMSQAMASYPTPIPLWSFLFFLEMSLVAFSTQAILILASCETFTGLIGHHRVTPFIVNIVFLICSAIVVSICHILGITFSIVLASFTTVMILLMSATILIFYGYGRLVDDFNFVLGYPPPVFIRVCWLLLPFISTLMLIFRVMVAITDSYSGPLIFANSVFPVACYVISGVVEAVRAHKRGNIMAVFLPNPDWVPQNHILKMSRAVFNSRTVTKESMYRQELDKKPQMKQPDFSEQNIVQPY